MRAKKTIIKEWFPWRGGGGGKPGRQSLEVIRCCQDSGKGDVKLFRCWKWIAGSDSLQREKLEERTKRGGWRKRKKRRRRMRGGVVEMRVAAPFFTADKNICWDINLKLRSSLPLLPRHPSSFRTNNHLGTPPLLPLPPPPTHMHTPHP